MNDSGSTPPDSLRTVVPPDASLLDGEQPLDGAVLDNETANAIQTRTTGRSVARATAGMLPLYIARLLMGFVAQPLIARNLGLSMQADAYAVATDYLQRIWLVFEKVLNPAVLPVFIGALKEEGEERAWRFASTAFWLVALLLGAATLTSWWQMPFIISHGYSDKSLNDPAKIELTVRLARLLLLGLWCLGISSLTYVLLNGYKRFVVAALGDAMWKFGVLGGAVVALRLHQQPAEALQTIAIGFLCGSFLKLFPQVLALRSKWHLLRPRIDFQDPLTRKMLSLCAPLLLGIFVSEARGIYLQYLADNRNIDIEAGRAALKWSRTIGDSLVQVFPYVLSIGIFPYLADLARERDRQPLTDTLLGALRVCFFVFGPVTAVIIALRFPLLRAVWEGGHMSENDTRALSGPFVGYTIGLIAFSCEMLLNQTFYAMTNTWIPTLMGLAVTVLWLFMARLGVAMGYGLTAIALAESLSKGIKCLGMWALLRPRLGDVKVLDNLLFAFKVACGSILAACVAAALGHHIVHHGVGGHGKLHALVAVTVAGCTGLTAFLVLGALTGIQEVHSAIGFASRIRRKFAGA